MLCPYCGLEYDDGFGKCPHCGAGTEKAGTDAAYDATGSSPEMRDYAFEGTKEKLIRFISGKGFLAVAVLLTVMTAISLMTVAGNTASILEVTFGVLATVAVWMARSAAQKGELKLKKGMLMTLPVYESVWAIVSAVIFVYAAVVMIIVGTVSISSVDEAQKIFSDISAATPTFMGNAFRTISGMLEEVVFSDPSAKRVIFISMSFGMAFSFVAAAVLDLVAGIFMIVANKKIKKLIVAGQCDGDLPNNLKKSGGMVMAAGIIGLFTTLNDIYFVILIIIGVGMRKLAAENTLSENK